MKKLLTPLMVGSLLIAAIAGSRAAPFANFAQMFPTAENFSFSGGNSGTLTSSMNPVFFTFGSGSGFSLAQPLLANQQIGANLNLTAVANGSPAIGGIQTTQQFGAVDFTFLTGASQTVNGVFIPAGAILLHGTANAAFPTPPLNQSAVLDGSSPSETFHAPLQGFPNLVTFNSDFIDFTGATGNGFSFGLSGAFTTTSNGLFGLSFNNFSAAGAGTLFSTASPPQVPEPNAVALFASLGVSGSLVVLHRRGRRGVKRA
jgi:hypothetical protein